MEWAELLKTLGNFGVAGLMLWVFAKIVVPAILRANAHENALMRRQHARMMLRILREAKIARLGVQEVLRDGCGKKGEYDRTQ